MPTFGSHAEWTLPLLVTHEPSTDSKQHSKNASGYRWHVVLPTIAILSLLVMAPTVLQAQTSHSNSTTPAHRCN